MQDELFVSPEATIVSFEGLAKKNESEFRAFIANLDLTRPIILAISPDQEYHKGPRLKAILKALHEQGVSVVIAIGDELKRFNFQVERNADSEESDAVKDDVAQLEATWPAINLNFDEETTALCNEMKSNNKLQVLNWRDCKLKFSESFRKSTESLQKIFDDPNSDFRRIVIEAATQFFNRAMAEKYATKDTVQLCLRERGPEWILDKFIRYVFEECCMFGAWYLEGFTQMAYPFDYYQSADDKTNTNSPLFNCVMAAIASLGENTKDNPATMELRNITFEKLSPSKSSRRQVRKGSLDASLEEKAQEKRMISDLKQKIRRLQEENQQHIYQINQLIRLFQEYHQDKDLPPQFSLILSKRAQLRANDELDTLGLREAQHELAIKIVHTKLPEVILQTRWLEAEVKRFEKHVEELTSLNQRLESEILTDKEEIQTLKESVARYQQELNASKVIIIEFATHVLNVNFHATATLNDLVAFLLETITKNEAELHTLRRMIQASEKGMRDLTYENQRLQAQNKAYASKEPALQTAKITLKQIATAQQLKERELTQRALALATREKELEEQAAKLQKEKEKHDLKKASFILGKRLARAFLGEGKKAENTRQTSTASPIHSASRPSSPDQLDALTLHAPQPVRARPHPIQAISDFFHRDRRHASRERSFTVCEKREERTPSPAPVGQKVSLKGRQKSAPDVPIHRKSTMSH